MNKSTNEIREWQGHEGVVFASENGFDVIDCRLCGFKHIIPIPTVEELESVYKHDYYQQEKPLYLDQYREDLDWWDMVYTQRYKILEQYLPVKQRRLLDIGSGPGFFLLNGQNRGWQTKGIEPSVQAVEHSRGLELDVEHGFYSEQTSSGLGTFDAINMSLVLEHLPDPAGFLKVIHHQLNDNGLVCIIVPNDFNPFQVVLRDHLGFKSWWVAPPHHINYFDFESLSNLVERCGFEIVHKESTFPIDMFLLMGDNYIENDELGRACHTKRMNFEKAMNLDGAGNALPELYAAFAHQGIGREVVIYAKRKGLR
ncbi:class I SAM-dependent methyltransferase [Pseudomonadota bacterium]